MTKEIGPRPATWPSQTQRDWLEMLPRTKWPWTQPTLYLVRAAIPTRRQSQNHWSKASFFFLITLKKIPCELRLWLSCSSPKSTLDAKRLIGRKFDDLVVQSDMKHWPFKVVNDSSKPKVEVEYKGEIKTFYPEEVSSMVLTKMKEISEAYLGKVDDNKCTMLCSTSSHLVRCR